MESLGDWNSGMVITWAYLFCFLGGYIVGTILGVIVVVYIINKYLS